MEENNNVNNANNRISSLLPEIMMMMVGFKALAVPEFGHF